MKWTGWAAGAMGILLVGSFALFSRADHAFSGLGQAYERLFAAGFHCTSDLANGKLATGFMISHDAVSWTEVAKLPKGDASGSRWRGKVWITVSPACFQLGAIPDHASARVWGRLIAFGDEEILSEIDRMLENS